MATFVAKKLVEKRFESYAPSDPMYELYTDEQGKQQQRKREIPPGLSERDANILSSVKLRAHKLDRAFSLCGMHFGWTFFICLIPVIGDIINAVLSYLLVREARRADLPQWLSRQMTMNNLFSFAVGLVPFAGDIVVAIFKANSRNAALLEEFLRLRGEEFLRLHPEGQVEAAPGGGWLDPEKGAALAKKGVEQVKPGSAIQQRETIELGRMPGALQEPDLPTFPQPDTTNNGHLLVPVRKDRA
ncbi:hypothetical protein MD484_g4763, partial [Candolleomyces efflorescens]